jgi:acetyl esterase
MRMLGRRLVVDVVARLAQRAPTPRIAADISFAEMPARTETMTIPTRHGDIQATVYWPEPSPAPPPVYLNFHGGGFVVRHPEQDDPLCRYLAAEAGAVVINVDYDVAPQHRFPEPVEEAYDAVTWAAGPGHRCGDLAAGPALRPARHRDAIAAQAPGRGRGAHGAYG